MQDENILIPKKGKEDQKEEKQEVKPDDEMAQQLQEEIRQLHFKVRQKEQIIEEFKKLAETYVDLKKSEDGGVTERSSKLEQLLQRDTFQEKATRQQTDQLLDLIAGDKIVAQADMVQFKGSMLLTAKDILRIFNDKNGQVKKFNELASEKETMIEERKQL